LFFEALRLGEKQIPACSRQASPAKGAGSGGLVLALGFGRESQLGGCVGRVKAEAVPPFGKLRASRTQKWAKSGPPRKAGPTLTSVADLKVGHYIRKGARLGRRPLQRHEHPPGGGRYG